MNSLAYKRSPACAGLSNPAQAGFVCTGTASAQRIQKPPLAARAALEGLQRRRLLTAENGRLHRLTALAQRTLTPEAKSARTTRETQVSLKERVLDYLARYATISGQEAAALCNLSPYQAYRLLNRMARQGQLELVNRTGRNARYRKRAPTR